MKRKLKVAIIGPGNIGIDLMCKLERSEYLELEMMIGIYPESIGLKMAEERGIKTSASGIEALMADDGIDLVFDSTSAAGHLQNAPILRALGKHALDLTPAAVGPYMVPAVLSDTDETVMNYNMVTCGGQATIPIVWAINNVADVSYAEIVATLASKSAGPGTRANIDEFTETTSRAIEKVGGSDRGKAIIILNPAAPPMMMRDTVYAKVKNPNKEKIETAVNTMVTKVQTYVPGYHLVVPPIFEEDKVTVMIEVEGAGDYLPKYAGNLDIMTSAAMSMAEEIAKKILKM